MLKIADNIAKVQARIQQAAQENCRDVTDIQLLAASKTHGYEEILAAYAAGIRHFGENYLQEALPKIEQLQQAGANDICWHFTGSIQSNKAAAIAEHFSWVHTVDRLKIAEKLDTQRGDGNLGPLNICIQINADNEASKSGISLGEIEDFAREVQALPALRLRGLMAIPNPNQPEDQLQSRFAALASALAALQQQYPAQPLDTLSMGMSGDLELAIAAGSTLVRVGTAIFGQRQQT